MSIVVMKFGGSSVGTAESMTQVATLVKNSLDRSPLVVLSAIGKTTNGLFRAAQTAQRGELDKALCEMQAIVDQHRTIAFELIPTGSNRDQLQGALDQRFSELEVLLKGVAFLRELTPRSMDAIASLGERLSTTIFTALLQTRAIDASMVDARSVMRTDDRFGSAEPQVAEIRRLVGEKLLPHLGPGKAIVTQGYIGSTAEGLTTTLGRGGSDYSAALFGAAVGAEEVQIWTDVEGVLTCDPRIVPEAQPISRLSFAEASELAAFGATVLHPATIQPAVEAGIPVTVRHTHRPQGNFTTITRDPATGRSVTALAYRGKTTVLTVSSSRMLHQVGFLARLFELFSRYRISVDLIATAEVSVSLTVDSDRSLKELLVELSEFAHVGVSEGRAIIAIVGEQLKQTAGLGARIFSALEATNIEMISMGASELNLSLVVKDDCAPEALRKLHSALFERV